MLVSNQLDIIGIRIYDYDKETKHGILVSFNIARKIKQSQIRAMRKKLEKSNIDPKKVENEIRKEIKSRTQKYLNQTDIPGMVTSDSYGEKITIDPKIQRKILSLANKVADFCKTNKFLREQYNYVFSTFQ